MHESNCDQYVLNGHTYTTTGIYTQTLINVAGCDSTINLNLVVNTPTDSVLKATVCDSYTLNGQTYNQSGTYTQAHMNAAGCDSTLTLELTVNSVDVINIKIETFDLTAMTNASGPTYQWIDCFDYLPIPNATNQVFTTPDQGGNFAAIVADGNCSDTSDCVSIVGLGARELRKENFSIYPNPAREELIFESINSTNNHPYELTIKEIAGKSLLNFTMDMGHVKTMDISELSEGLYLLEVRSKGSQSTYFKFVKAN